MTRLLTLFACGLSLAACAPTSESAGADPSAPATLPRTHAPQGGVAPVTCSPREWGKLVGKPVAEARLPAGLTYRVIPRGAMITDEYRDERLNVITDPATGHVVEVSCG